MMLHDEVLLPVRISWVLPLSPMFFSGVHVTQYLVLVTNVCPFVLLPLAIVLSLLVLFTDTDFPFSIFQTFLLVKERRKKKRKNIMHRWLGVKWLVFLPMFLRETCLAIYICMWFPSQFIRFKFKSVFIHDIVYISIF